VATASKNTTLLFVGAVSEGKGVLVLLEACSELRARGFDFVLKIVGRFDSREFEDRCRKYVQDNDLNNRVRFLGSLTGDAKWEQFADSDIFCFPSHYLAENQPIVILEAMQFALPVVATDWRGISTMVEDGQSGFVVPTRNSIALADCIGKLIQDPSLRKKMGAKGRATFLTKYTDTVWRPAMESALKGP
jgi:glycosyltransferase involved in cell wall biosynthesis